MSDLRFTETNTETNTDIDTDADVVVALDDARVDVGAEVGTPPRGRRRWLPIVALVVAGGAVAGAVVTAGAAAEDQSTARSVEREAEERLATLEAEAEAQAAELSELADPAQRFRAVADDAADAVKEATALGVEEMELNRSSVRLALYGTETEYNRLIDALNAQWGEQYEAAMAVHQLLSRLRAVDI